MECLVSYAAIRSMAKDVFDLACVSECALAVSYLLTHIIQYALEMSLYEPMFREMRPSIVAAAVFDFAHRANGLEGWVRHDQCR